MHLLIIVVVYVSFGHEVEAESLDSTHILQILTNCITHAVHNSNEGYTVADFFDITRFTIQDNRVPTIQDRCEFAKVL